MDSSNSSKTPMLPENTFPLPTLQNLGVDPTLIPEDLNPNQIVDRWVAEFSRHVDSANIAGVMELLLPEHVYWRDALALTWDFRTFAGSRKIQSFLEDRLFASGLTNVSLAHKEYITHAKPAPGLQWIQFFFKFETGEVGTGLGIVRLVPALSNQNEKTVVWKAHVIATYLEDLQGFPEKIGSNRDSEVYAGNRNWVEERKKATTFEDRNPTVLVIGGAQSGLVLAARLKMLNVDCLVLERGDRIGGNWIERYDSLKLHDPVWYDHLPYLPFPSNWPVFTPASKLASWLQFYAEAMELDVWLSSTVTNVTRDTATNLWRVTVDRTVTKGSKSETQCRLFTVKHVVFAIGLVAEEPQIPTYPGMETYKGEMLHAFRFKSAERWAGKKVLVIGACASGHDISSDCYHHGADVTMYQRSPTYVISVTKGMNLVYRGLYGENSLPIDLADRIMASSPPAMAVPLLQMQTQVIAQIDKDLLDGLNKRGFRTYLGKMEAGFIYLIYERAGGYYLDTGGSQLIIDGKVKVCSGSPIKKFVSNGIELENGEVLSADVVVFATGLGDIRASIAKLCDPDTANKLKPLWGLDDEGESRGVYRDMGVPGLWCMFGNLGGCRFRSKHVALQIKAMEEGLFGERYEK